MTWPLKAALAALTVALGAAVSYSLSTFWANVHLNRAQESLPLGQYEPALAALSRARALTPGDAALAREQGKANQLLYAFRRDDAYAQRAFEFFREATVLNPLDGENFSNLGWSYMVTNHLVEAEAAFKEALKRDPHNVHYLYSFGKLKEREGDAAGARALYERALSVKHDARVAARLGALAN